MTELFKFRRPELLQAFFDSERAAFIQRCGEHDHDHRAAGRYRRVSSTVREAARGGIRARIHTPSRGAFLNCDYISGCWPSCAFHAHSVTCISVNRAVKLEFSGLHAYMPNRIFPAPSSMWQIRIWENCTPSREHSMQ